MSATDASVKLEKAGLSLITLIRSALCLWEEQPCILSVQLLPHQEQPVQTSLMSGGWRKRTPSLVLMCCTKTDEDILRRAERIFLSHDVYITTKLSHLKHKEISPIISSTASSVTARQDSKENFLCYPFPTSRILTTANMNLSGAIGGNDDARVEQAAHYLLWCQICKQPKQAKQTFITQFNIQYLTCARALQLQLLLIITYILLCSLLYYFKKYS